MAVAERVISRSVKWGDRRSGSAEVDGLKRSFMVVLLLFSFIPIIYYPFLLAPIACAEGVRRCGKVTLFCPFCRLRGM